MSADLGNSHEIALTEVGENATGPQARQVGLNHMAWYMDSLEDLEELYYRVKEKGIEIERVSDHGHAIGIYIHDPDGNGIELSYEMPASEWGHDESAYMIGGTKKGRLSGPWDAEIAPAGGGPRLAQHYKGPVQDGGAFPHPRLGLRGKT